MVSRSPSASSLSELPSEVTERCTHFILNVTLFFFVTTICKDIFLFPKTPRPALGHRASSLGTGVIYRSYSYRGVELTTLVSRLKIIGAVPSLRPSTGWAVQRGWISRTCPNRPRGPSVLSLGVKRPERGVHHPPHLAPRLKNGHRWIDIFVNCNWVNTRWQWLCLYSPPLSASMACLG